MTSVYAQQGGPGDQDAAIGWRGLPEGTIKWNHVRRLPDGTVEVPYFDPDDGKVAVKSYLADGSSRWVGAVDPFPFGVFDLPRDADVAETPLFVVESDVDAMRMSVLAPLVVPYGLLPAGVVGSPEDGRWRSEWVREFDLDAYAVVFVFKHAPRRFRETVKACFPRVMVVDAPRLEDLDPFADESVEILAGAVASAREQGWLRHLMLAAIRTVQ